jgi:predicted PurR-regulated permease PerM
MVAVIGAALAAGFYLVGLNYWLLVGGAVSLFEIIPVVGPLIGVLLVIAVGLPQSIHVTVLAVIVLVAVREFQSYVINPHVMGRSVGLSPLVTLVTVSVVGLSGTIRPRRRPGGSSSRSEQRARADTTATRG